jgi:hypothetical protein
MGPVGGLFNGPVADGPTGVRATGPATVRLSGPVAGGPTGGPGGPYRPGGPYARRTGRTV